MKKLILVLGARSSGTRAFTKMLLSAGVVGDGDDLQRLSVISPYDSGYAPPCSREEALELLQGTGYCVLRRSFPHGMDWPDPEIDAGAFQAEGSSLACAFWMQRDIYATCQSMVLQGHEPDLEAALLSVRRAQIRLATCFLRLIPVTYELLDQSLYWLRLIQMARISIHLPEVRLFKNGNAKYYRPLQVTLASPQPEGLKVVA